MAVAMISMADAMGILDGMVVDRLDWSTFRRIVDRVASVGIGKEVQAVLSTGDRDSSRLDTLLDRMVLAIEESPLPSHEWSSLVDLFEIDRLARLLGVSPASVRRYRSGGRATPDDVAGRLHFLATVVGDLAGAYNEFGIRRWFDRPRTLLGGKAPADLLSEGWNPDDPGVQRIRELARSLGASAAT